MKDIIKIISVIMGTTIGAGFASGKEIHIFFNMYGTKGILGIILTSVLTGLLIYQVLKITYKNNINSYNEFTEIIANRKKTILQKIITVIINLFLLISYYIMVAGFTEYLSQALNIPQIIGAIAFNVLVLIFTKNIKRVIIANTALIPIAIITIIALGINDINITNIAQMDFIEYNKHWIISAVLYYSYNSIILVPILISMKEYIKKPKQITMISIITGIILAVLSIIIFFLISDLNIKEIEMPLVDVANRYLIFRYLYGIVILISIFTTAISSSHNLINNISDKRGKYVRNMLLVTVSSIPISFIGFSNLVLILYPTFGMLGIIQIIKIYRYTIVKNNIY